MLVLCDGMPRSASTWSFNVVKGLLRHSDPDSKVIGGYDEDVAAFLTSTAATADHVVLKCHTLDSHARELVRCGAAKAVYTHRDVREATVSCMAMFGYDFDQALAAIASSLEVWRFHLREQNALILDYVELTTRPGDCIERIASYLGVAHSSELVADISEETSITRMREVVTDLEQSGAEAFDSETLLHPRHFTDGHGAALTADQLERLAEVLAEHERGGAPVEEHL